MNSIRNHAPAITEALKLGLLAGLIVFLFEFKLAFQKPYVFVKEVVPNKASFEPKYSEWKIEKIEEIEGPQQMITLSKRVSFLNLACNSIIVGMGVAIYKMFEIRRSAK